MVSDAEHAAAERRMASRLRKGPRAIAARFRRAGNKILVRLDTGVELSVSVDLIQGLAGAKEADLAEIRLTPTGLGLHWPRLDADLYVPGLLEGQLGSRAWMARPTAGDPGQRSRKASPSPSKRIASA